jgi:hypothetical protein
LSVLEAAEDDDVDGVTGCGSLTRSDVTAPASPALASMDAVSVEPRIRYSPTATMTTTAATAANAKTRQPERSWSRATESIGGSEVDRSPGALRVSDSGAW